MRVTRSLVLSTAVLGTVAAGTAATLAAPPVDSALFAYGQAACAGDTGFIVNAPTILTRAGFDTSVDGDNDVNPGSAVAVSMGILDSGPYIPIGDNVVQLSFAGESRPVTFPSFEKPGTVVPYLPEGATSSFTVPDSAIGTVVQARVDSWTFRHNFTGSCTTAAGEGIVGLYVNTPPVLADDEVTTDFETAVDIDVLTNDDATWDSGTIDSRIPTDAEVATQDDLTEIPTASLASALAVVAAPAHGTATVNADGTIAYEPTDDVVGTDSFTYSVTDNDGAVSTADVVVEREVPALAELTLVPSATSVAQGGTLTFTATGETAGGYDLGDVTDEVTLASDVATDVVDDAAVTFPTASPHTITATHTATGVTDAVVVEVVAPGVTPPAANPGGIVPASVAAGDLPSTGGPAATWLAAAALALTAGTALLVRRRRTA